MAATVHIDADEYTVRWDDELGAVVHEWNGFVTGEAFKDACWELLEVLKETGATKLLIDQRSMKAMDESDMGWMVQEWTPEISDTAVEYTVIVIAESTIAEMNVERTMDGVGEVEGDQDMTSDIDEAHELIRAY